MAPPKGTRREQAAAHKLDGNHLASARRDAALLAALITVVCVATAATHWPALSAKAYSFDDSQYLLRNRLVQNPSWDSARRFLVEILKPTTVEGYYQPLAMISLMLDHALGGRSDHLRPFHRTSLALHVVNSGLVIVLLYLLFGSPWPAALAGLLFAVHPLTVEPIPWIGERKTLLGAFFALVCLILYVVYVRRNGSPMSGTAAAIQTRRGTVRGLYLASLLSFLLALMSKPTTTPIPALLLLMDYWPLRRLGRRTFLEKVPFFVFGSVSAVVTFISQARTASVTLPGARPAGWVPLTLCYNVVFYLYKLVWPANLSSHYPFPDPMSLAHPMVRAGVIGTVLILVILLVSWRRTRAGVTGWGFFFVAIFPTLGVIGFTDVIASDKFAYLPSLGILMLVAWGLGWAWRRPASPGPLTPGRAGIASAVLLIAAAEATATRRYLAIWQDTDRFWKHMLESAPGASMLRSNYAGFLIEAGRLDEAAEFCLQALALNPENYAAHNALGGVRIKQGRAEEAIVSLREALRIRPGDYIVHGNLAAALLRLGQEVEGMSHYAEALRLQPKSPEVHFNLAGALAQQGKTEEALHHYAEAVRLNPRWAEAHNRMGVLLASQGRLDAALQQFAEAASLKPDWAEAHENLGVTLAQLGRADEAIEAYSAALGLDPNLADVHFNLADALVVRERLDEALVHYRAVLRLRPDDVEARYRVAETLVRRKEFDAAILEYREVVRGRPTLAEAHNDLGVLLAQQGDLAGAVTHFSEAARLRPDWEEARNNLARARLEQKRRVTPSP